MNGDQIVSLNKEKKIVQYNLQLMLKEGKQESMPNAIKINVLDQDKLIVKNAGSQFQILDKDLKEYGLATPDQINKSLINIENSSIQWSHRIEFNNFNNQLAFRIYIIKQYSNK